jgi:hypothetical protein
MATKKNQLGTTSPRQPDGRPSLVAPDPKKLRSNQLGRRALPQVPSVAPSKIRHTALPSRGSR